MLVLFSITCVACAANRSGRAFALNRRNEETIRRRAAFDLSCPASQIELFAILTRRDVRGVPREDQNGGEFVVIQWGAAGCDHRTAYVHSATTGWVLNSEASRD